MKLFAEAKDLNFIPNVSALNTPKAAQRHFQILENYKGNTN